MLPVSALPPSPAAASKGAGTDASTRSAEVDAAARGAGVLPFALILAVADDAGAAPETALAALPARDDAATGAGADATLTASPLLFAAYVARDPASVPEAAAAKRIRDGSVATLDVTADARPAPAIPAGNGALPGAATAEDAALPAGPRRDERNATPTAPAFAAAAIAAAEADPTAANADTAAAAVATTEPARALARRTETSSIARSASAAPGTGAGTETATAAATALANDTTPGVRDPRAARDVAAAAATAPASAANADAARARAGVAVAPAAATASPTTPRGSAPVVAATAAPALAAAVAQDASLPQSEAPGAPSAATLAAPTVPTAVARADAPVVATPVGAEGWTQDVAQHLAHVVTLRNGHAELQLTPPHLGPIEVRISFAAGEPTLAITAADPGTRAALEQSLPQLRELLANQGITLGQAFVQGEAQRQQAYAPAPPRAPAADAAATAGAAAVPVASARSRGGDRLVDTFA